MKPLHEIIVELESNQQNIRFSKLLNICEHFFGKPRISGSHHIFKTPWPGDPRINIQMGKGAKGKPKPYQVKQVLQALRKLEGSNR